MRVQRRGSASQQANQNPRGRISAVFLKSREKCDNSWTLCSCSPLPSFPCFWEHMNSHSLMKSGRLSQLQCWDTSGHGAHYPNFLCNGLTPGHSVRVSQLKAASHNHISLQSSSRGEKYQPQQPYSSRIDIVQSNSSTYESPEECSVQLSRLLNSQVSRKKSIWLWTNQMQANFHRLLLWALSVGSYDSLPRNKMKNHYLS